MTRYLELFKYSCHSKKYGGKTVRSSDTTGGRNIGKVRAKETNDKHWCTLHRKLMIEKHESQTHVVLLFVISSRDERKLPTNEDRTDCHYDRPNRSVVKLLCRKCEF